MERHSACGNAGGANEPKENPSPSLRDPSLHCLCKKRENHREDQHRGLPARRQKVTRKRGPDRGFIERSVNGLRTRNRPYKGNAYGVSAARFVLSPRRWRQVSRSTEEQSEQAVPLGNARVESVVSDDPRETSRGKRLTTMTPVYGARSAPSQTSTRDTIVRDLSPAVPNANWRFERTTSGNPQRDRTEEATLPA